MSYDIGTHINLEHLNRRSLPVVKKKSFQEAIDHLVEVGTSYTFENGKARLHIPVVYA